MEPSQSSPTASQSTPADTQQPSGDSLLDPALRYLVRPPLDQANSIDSPLLSPTNLPDLQPWRQIGFGSPNAVAFAPDETWMVVATSAGLLYINLPDLTLLRFDPVGPVNSIRLAPDAASVVADESARYSVRDGAQLDLGTLPPAAPLVGEFWIIASPLETFEAALEVPDSVVVPGVTVRRVDDATTLYSDDQTFALAFSPTERVVALIGLDERLRLLDLGTASVQIIELPGFRDAAFSSDGLRMITSGQSLTVWDVVETTSISSLALNDVGGRQTLLFGDPGTLIVLDSYSSVFEGAIHTMAGWRIDPQTGLEPQWEQMLPAIHIVNAASYRSAVSPVSNLAVVVDASVALTWWQDGAAVYTHTLPAAAQALAFDPSGTTVASGDAAGTLLLWQRDTAQPLRTIAVDAAVMALQFSPDGTLLVSRTEAGTIDVWDLTGRRVAQFVDPPVVFESGETQVLRDQRLVITDNNEWLLIPGSAGVRFYDIATGRLLTELAVPAAHVAIGPHRRLVATAHNGMVTLWQAP